MLMHAEGVGSSFHLWRAGMKRRRWAEASAYNTGRELQVLFIYTHIPTALRPVHVCRNPASQIQAFQVLIILCLCYQHPNKSVLSLITCAHTWRNIYKKASLCVPLCITHKDNDCEQSCYFLFVFWSVFPFPCNILRKASQLQRSTVLIT